ncbi:MAG: TetR/AcrR family transcriptional regulator [Acidimicrobiia bacterium]
MARTRSPERLDTIAAAALATFAAAGYRRTRMSDVAAAAGVSPGLLYTYAESKEALFALVVQRESGVDIGTLPLPVANPTEAELVALLRRALRDLTMMPALAASEGVEHPDDVVAEVAGIVGEQYDAVSRHRTLLRLVERCAADWPALAESFYEKGRRPHIRRLARYLGHRRDAGLLAPIDDPEIAARFVIETVAWFANHRFGDHDGARLDDAAVRAEVVSLVTRALTCR